MSMATPDSRITLPITEPRVSRCQRERRVAPITIWVAFRERAASRSASPTSAPTTSWYVPPSSPTSSRCCASSSADGAASAVLGDDVDSDELALRALRDAGGAADQPLAVGGAGEG